MKKKRNFLSIISGLLGTFAIVGSLAISSLLSNKKQDVEQTKAYDDIFVETILLRGSTAYKSDYIEDGQRIISEYDMGIISYSVDIDMYRNVDNYGVNIYKMVLRFNLNFYAVATNTPIDGLSNINFTYYSNYFYTNYSVFDFYFSHWQSYYIQIDNSNYYNYYFDFDFKVAENNTENFLVETHNEILFNTYDNALGPTIGELYYRAYCYNVRPYNTLPTRYFYLLNTFTVTNLNDEFAQGYTNGYNNGYEQGFNQGQSGGYASGYDEGYLAGVQSQQNAINQAYNNGYNEGYASGSSSSTVVSSIFSGIVSVGLLPINFFLSIFDFEILGINIRGFVSAILTICVTVIVIRLVSGKSGD